MSAKDDLNASIDALITRIAAANPVAAVAANQAVNDADFLAAKARLDAIDPAAPPAPAPAA